jgi:nicotinate-nucleotide adenylyltransferase
MRKVRALSPEARLFFVLGVDAFLDIGTWREYERVLAECLFIVIGRPGYELERARDVLGGRLRERIAPAGDGQGLAGRLPPGAGVFLMPIEAIDVSSTEVRERARRGRSLDGLVPEAVERYIRDHQLYKGR